MEWMICVSIIFLSLVSYHIGYTVGYTLGRSNAIVEMDQRGKE